MSAAISASASASAIEQAEAGIEVEAEAEAEAEAGIEAEARPTTPALLCFSLSEYRNSGGKMADGAISRPS